MYLFVVLINAVAGSSKKHEKDDRKFLIKHKPCSRKRMDHPDGKNRKLSRAVAETAGVLETVDLETDSEPKVRVQSLVKFVYPQLPITVTPSSSSSCGVASTSFASQHPCKQEEREAVGRISSPDLFNNDEFLNEFLNTQQVADFSNTQEVAKAVFEGGDGVDALSVIFKNLPSEPQVNKEDPLPEVQTAGTLPEVQTAGTNQMQAHDRFPDQIFTLADARKFEISKFKEVTRSLEKKQEDIQVKLAILQSEYDEIENQKQACIEETKRLESSLQFFGNIGNL